MRLSAQSSQLANTSQGGLVPQFLARRSCPAPDSRCNLPKIVQECIDHAVRNARVDWQIDERQIGGSEQDPTELAHLTTKRRSRPRLELPREK